MKSAFLSLHEQVELNGLSEVEGLPLFPPLLFRLLPTKSPFSGSWSRQNLSVVASFPRHKTSNSHAIIKGLPLKTVSRKNSLWKMLPFLHYILAFVVCTAKNSLLCFLSFFRHSSLEITTPSSSSFCVARYISLLYLWFPLHHRHGSKIAKFDWQ